MDTHELQVYEDHAGEYRWRKVTRSIGGEWELVAESGEGYTRKDDAVEAGEREFPFAKVVDLDEDRPI